MSQSTENNPGEGTLAPQSFASSRSSIDEDETQTLEYKSVRRETSIAHSIVCCSQADSVNNQQHRSSPETSSLTTIATTSEASLLASAETAECGKGTYGTIQIHPKVYTDDLEAQHQETAQTYHCTLLSHLPQLPPLPPPPKIPRIPHIPRCPQPPPLSTLFHPIRSSARAFRRGLASCNIHIVLIFLFLLGTVLQLVEAILFITCAASPRCTVPDELYLWYMWRLIHS
ncbi:hypothetical protein F5Y15DRAFT_413747 [Xylariaceae sp. FL0016]|nr:hypothetical protein F5Y15DRAFT_413747 [Xylariaceae sp. FL0016]